MKDTRHVKLFRHGTSQVVNIPHGFELPGEDALMRKEGGRLIIEPAARKSLLAVLETLAPVEECLSEIGDKPPDPIEL